MRTDINPPHVEGHMFFDPEPPEVPSDVLGIPTEPLLNLAKAAGHIAYISAGSGHGFTGPGFAAQRSIPPALVLFPLIERIQTGEEVEPEDIRPYRKPIKRLVPKLNTADKAAALAGGLLVGIPVRRALNRRVEHEFPEHLPDILDKADDYLALAEPYVEFLGEFENPREQFVSELATITHDIYHVSYLNSKRNGRSHAVTAQDAAVGITQTVEAIFSDRESAKRRLPILSKLVIEQLSEDAHMPNSDNLGVVAPEIIYALEAALPKDRRTPGFLNSIDRYPHPKRRLAETFKAAEIRYLGRAASLLLPSIRDLLPADGQELYDILDRAENLLDLDPRNGSEDS